MNVDEFLQKVFELHKDKFNYSIINYTNKRSKVNLICNKEGHGEFEVIADTHLKSTKGGCPKCIKEHKSKKQTLTSEDAINNLKLIHGEKYDYSLFEYKDKNIKSTIICEVHGEFKMTYNYHRQSRHCPLCASLIRSNNYKFDPENFIKKVNKIHDNKYDYSQMSYRGLDKKIKIICEKHGEFSMRPDYHKRGFGCPECVLQEKQNKKIKSFKEVHGEKFDYSLVKYKKWDIPVDIICKTHGIFSVTPNYHLSGGHCPECSKIERRKKTAKNTNEIIAEFKAVHGDKFDYSLVDYESRAKKVKIICRDHGVFETPPRTHLISKNVGCPKCCGKTLTNEERINVLKEIFSEENYDYSKFDYVAREKVTIICPEHGEFKKQYSHMTHYFQGCPSCKGSSKGEIQIEKWLNSYNFEFEKEKSFEECKNKFVLRFDFYLPLNKTLIEFQGKQHYESVEIWGGEKSLLYRQKNDSIKRDFAKKYNYKLLYIKYDEKVEEVLSKHLL